MVVAVVVVEVVVVVVVVVVVTGGVVCACAGTATVRRMGFVQDDGRTIATPANPAIVSNFLRVATCPPR